MGLSFPFEPAHLLNTERYPIQDISSTKTQNTIRQVKSQLREDGCAVIADFLSADGLSQLLAEAQERRPFAYFSTQKKTNVYFSEDDPALPLSHPRRIFLDRTNGFVPSDCYDKTTASRTLFQWPALKRFIQECLGKTSLHQYADPVADMPINVLTPGGQFNWHFDTNEFTITLLLKGAEQGGHFEYAPNLRNESDERYDDVAAVLAGDTSRVKRLDLKAGDLQLFLGRFSLHQVTPNTGATDRLVLIMSFAEKSGMIGSLTRTKELYGKVTDAHIQAQQHHVRADKLLD